MYSPPIANQFGLASIDGYDGSHNFGTSTRDPGVLLGQRLSGL